MMSELENRFVKKGYEQPQTKNVRELTLIDSGSTETMAM